MKVLFFDDSGSFRREGLTRVTGRPELIATYRDGHSDTSWSTGFIFRLDDGRFRMLYQGRQKDGTDRLYSALSVDGIRFEPETEVMQIFDAEVAAIVEDILNAPEERYKLLLCEYGKLHMLVRGSLFVSRDLIHWKRLEGVTWNNGSEPITGVFYNEKKDCFTITMRPDWGVRMVGVRETRDWRNYTDYQPCLRSDALDQPLDELYGMPAFRYGDMFIGLPLIYRNFEAGNHSKFWKGTIEAFLAYSDDGRYWLRSLRTPFLSGLNEETRNATGAVRPLVWPSSFRIADDGSILIYGSASEREHGPAFSEFGDGCICVWHLRRDGFIALEAGSEGGIVSTREVAWHGGELSVNITAKRATLAVYESSGGVLPYVAPVPGFGHNDCVPFSGDSVDWTPVFANGRKIDELKRRTLVFELSLSDGRVYSLSGDGELLFNVAAARVREDKS
ncbi:MAG: hypothetical protein J6X34_09265 [Clostridia bacterium]|nr:hypothetical protein [Clostridia bacterium]